MPFKCGKFTDTVLDVTGGESSQALHGVESQPLNLSTGGEFMLLTPVEFDPSETEPCASISTAHLWCVSNRDGSTMLTIRTPTKIYWKWRLWGQIKKVLAEKQLKPTMLQPQVTQLRIQLLEKTVIVLLVANYLLLKHSLSETRLCIALHFFNYLVLLLHSV